MSLPKVLVPQIGKEFVIDENTDITENYLSSSSDESDCDLSLNEYNHLYATFMICTFDKGPLQLRPRMERYIENIVARYSAEEFNNLFSRMYPETFEFVLALIGAAITTTKSISGRKPIPADKQLLIALWVMATPDSYRYLENRDEYFPNNSHIIDAAYGIHPQLLTPYKDNGHLTARQNNYNFCHTLARIAIERAFGLLKSRFRRLLDCLPLTDIQYVPEFILACCVLHNICLGRNDLIDPVHDNANLQRNCVNRVQNRQGGIAKRQEITNNLIMRE
ncbi:hypothetical protein NQ314_004980 [Rhamnusium bicolor]|uniref:DDE Tnp4 domain-containing protein n=1 Tax=Rhamnusium bicolor TaxID=1586634 RepID=A0AAV8ZJJ8_9CUCU|nr:hypothetical protein NQ314_004980 [Rhamnusium bicolor]